MKNLDHKLCQLIVKRFIKGNINWAREIKIAKKLIKKFKGFEFWSNLKDLGNPPPSLAWFLKPEGKSFLLKEYEIFNLKLSTNTMIVLKEHDINQNKNICKKPKTLLQFIRYGKKI